MNGSESETGTAALSAVPAASGIVISLRVQVAGVLDRAAARRSADLGNGSRNG